MRTQSALYQRRTSLHDNRLLSLKASRALSGESGRRAATGGEKTTAKRRRHFSLLRITGEGTAQDEIHQFIQNLARFLPFGRNKNQFSLRPDFGGRK